MDDLISRKALIAEYDRVHIGPAGGARKLMEDAPAVQKWIPVTERLPSDRGDVLVVAWWHENGKRWSVGMVICLLDGTLSRLRVISLVTMSPIGCPCQSRRKENEPWDSISITLRQ